MSVNGTTLTLSVGTTSLTRNLALNTWAAVSFVVDGSNSRLKVGNSEITGTLASFTSDFLVLGSCAAIRMAEIIRYPFALNSTDRGLVDAYLEDRYNFVNRATDPDVTGTPAPIVPAVVTPVIYVAETRTITINGVAQDLSADRTFTVAGSGGSEYTTTPVKTANYTAVSGDRIPCDTVTTGAFTITLPASGRVAVFDVRGNSQITGFGLNNLTIVPTGGKTIMGDTASLILNYGAIAVDLELIGTDWRNRIGG